MIPKHTKVLEVDFLNITNKPLKLFTTTIVYRPYFLKRVQYMFDLNTYADVHIIIQPTKHLLLIILIRQMSTRMKLRGLGGDVMKH